MGVRRTKRNYHRVNRTFGYICVYCGGYGDTVDHVVPWSYIQDQSVSNLVRACSSCNSMASNLVFGSFTEKRNYIRERRTTLGYGISGALDLSDETDIEDRGDAIPVIDAQWEELDEDEDSRKCVVTPGLPGKSDVVIECGRMTASRTACALSVLSCSLHSRKHRRAWRDTPWEEIELQQAMKDWYASQSLTQQEI